MFAYRRAPYIVHLSVVVGSASTWFQNLAAFEYACVYLTVVPCNVKTYKRARERERERERYIYIYIYIQCTYTYVYIYIYIYTSTGICRTYTDTTQPKYNTYIYIYNMCTVYALYIYMYAIYIYMHYIHSIFA